MLDTISDKYGLAPNLCKGKPVLVRTTYIRRASAPHITSWPKKCQENGTLRRKPISERVADGRGPVGSDPEEVIYTLYIQLVSICFQGHVGSIR